MVSYIVWFLKSPYFGLALQTGPPDGPQYRLIVEIATFCHHVIWPPNGPHSGCLVESAVFGPNFLVGQQMAPIQSWLFADCLTVLFQWPWNGKEDGNLGKPSYKVGWHPYLLSQLELTWHGDSFNFWSPNPTQVWCPHEKNCHAKLAPTGSINMGASPLRNLASLSYHPL